MGRVNDSIMISLRTTDKADWAINGTRNEAGEVQKVFEGCLEAERLALANPLITVLGLVCLRDLNSYDWFWHLASAIQGFRLLIP
jgi:hypothetical protein